MVFWTWAQPGRAGMPLEGHDAWGERERGRGRRVQTYLSVAFTTDRLIAESKAAWVMTACLGDLSCPPPLKHI